MPRKTTALLVWIELTGCTHTLNVYLTGRTSGVTGKTDVLVMPGHPSGDVSLTLKGKTYTGRWVYVSGGGSVGITSATVVSGAAHTTTGTGMAVGLPSGGNGTMNLTAPDGSSVRCVYQYSEWSMSGVGVCQDSDGEMYDAQIS